MPFCGRKWGPCQVLKVGSCLTLRNELSEETYMLTKVYLVKAMVFPVVMYGYESWTIKKAES